MIHRECSRWAAPRPAKQRVLALRTKGSHRAIVCALSLSIAPGAALADSFDPNVPTVITVGTPRGAVTQARLDGHRTGQSTMVLPDHPSEIWRRSLGTIEVTPLIDERGTITLALASAEMVALSSDGKELWRTRMQGGGPAAAPIRLSDGTACIVSTGGFFVGVSPRGKLRFSTALGVRGPDLMAPPVATDDGGAAVVAGRSLLTLDADGRIETDTPLPAHVSTAPLVTSDGLLVIGDDGSVTRVRPPKQPQKVGSFQGMLDGGAVMADERTLLGVMRDRLLALDLKTGVVSVRASTGNFSVVDGPVVVSKTRSVFYTTSDGLLVGIDRTGQELSRAAVERVLPPTAPGGQPGYPPGVPPGGYSGGLPSFTQSMQRSNPPLVIDAAGRIAFVRSSGRFGISAADGSSLQTPRRANSDGDATKRNEGPSGSAKATGTSVDLVSEHVCNTPIAVLPAADGRVAVVCREGLVAVFSD